MAAAAGLTAHWGVQQSPGKTVTEMSTCLASQKLATTAGSIDLRPSVGCA